MPSSYCFYLYFHIPHSTFEYSIIFLFPLHTFCKCAQFFVLSLPCWSPTSRPVTCAAFFLVISWYDALMMEKPFQNEKDRFLSPCGHSVTLPHENVDVPWHYCDPQSSTHACLSILVHSFTLIVLLVLHYVSAAERVMPQVFSAGGCK